MTQCHKPCMHRCGGGCRYQTEKPHHCECERCFLYDEGVRNGQYMPPLYFNDEVTIRRAVGAEGPVFHVSAKRLRQDLTVKDLSGIVGEDEDPFECARQMLDEIGKP
jgi:hypothetical protein